ncbi:hypothetical protein ABOM_002343 [Aspergillus bombycis]|uniref:F-box domain protein n=1 Tax=Aspergillus bombycis TaxID=109264 RepID=A0A1F8ABF7_9EURO|nr:hypothetical protein ABOM_002343 [Aspergillus bombycis]OGM49050.1 hypothetical protein ABOM_002343 [Aspergillus bombycis]
MVTRGLVFIRCHGRYFVYYNMYDSYLEGLGEAIEQQIPANVEKYHEWLESMRKVFAVLVQKLKAQYLPLTIPDFPSHGGSTSSLAQRYMKSFLAVDDRLDMPPMQTLLPHLWRSCIDYMYTLDLDRELLGVDHSVYFKLSEIPRGGRWHQYLDWDENRFRMVLRGDTPQNILGDAALKPSINSEARAKYDAIAIELMPSEVCFGSSGTLPPRAALLLSTFSCIHSSFKELLDPFILEWTPESFSFREIAFALLSIAAGEVTFESVRALDKNYETEGYYILPDAPQNRTYWFSNILVHLASRLDMVDVEKAAVIEAVDAGLDQGLDEFYAMIFSISDVILVHVQKGDGRVRVQRSDLMPLFCFHEQSSRYLKGPRIRITQDTQPPMPGTDANHTLQYKIQIEDDTSRCSKASDGNDDVKTMIKGKKTNVNLTFILMVQFLDRAARLRLADATSRKVPNEILTSIMHFTDTQTYKNLANVSASCRQLSDRKFRLTDSYDVVGTDAQSMGTSRRFIMEDIHTGERFYPEMQRSHSNALDFSFGRNAPENAPENMLELYIVIGEESTRRRNIISLATLRFQNLPPTDTRCTKSVEMPVPEWYCHDFGRTWVVPTLFRIPDYQYLGFIENAWGKYLRTTLEQESRCPELAKAGQILSARYRCLLPLGYRELRMAHHDCNGLQAFLRHPQDESHEEWMKTIEYAVHRLSRKEQYPTVFLERGCPAVIAFGTRVKLFYYVYHREEAPVLPPNASPANIQYAVSCTDPEPKHRLVQLIPGSEPINLKHTNDLVKFEEWLRVFCNNKDIETEWDPITGEHITMTRRTREVKDTE